MLCHGSVRVPEDAKLGTAIIRVEMPAGTTYGSFATDIPVTVSADLDS